MLQCNSQRKYIYIYIYIYNNAYLYTEYFMYVYIYIFILIKLKFIICIIRVADNNRKENLRFISQIFYINSFL